MNNKLHKHWSREQQEHLARLMNNLVSWRKHVFDVDLLIKSYALRGMIRSWFR